MDSHVDQDMWHVAVLFLVLLSVLVTHVTRERAEPPTTLPAEDSTVAALADLRYTALLVPSSLRVVYHILGAAICFNALYTASASREESHLYFRGVFVAFAILATFGAIHWASASATTATQMMRLYRSACAATQICFRGQRIVDLLSAHDRASFVRVAGAVLDHHVSMTTYSCFMWGWLVGMIQPSRPLGWRIAWVLGMQLAPLVPATVGLLATGEARWVEATFQVISIPSALGYIVTLVQSLFIKSLLRHTIRNELVMQLPHGQKHAEASALPPSRGGSSGRESPLSLSDFEPIGILGWGSSAQVRLMRNTRRGGQLQAVKSMFKTRGGRALDERGVRYVHEEQAILRASHDHPYIVSFIDSFEDATAYHVVLEYAANGSLGTWISQRGLGEVVSRGIAAEVTLALEHLHGLCILYRDLKPENVLVHKSGHIVLADFGVSKRISVTSQLAGEEQFKPRIGPTTASLPEALSLVGTPGYIAPEILGSLNTKGDTYSRQCHYSFAADWWSFGVLCHVMIAAEQPFDIQTVVDMIATPQAQPRIVAERLSTSLSDDATDLISGLLNFDVKERLGTALGTADIMAHPFFAEVAWDVVRTGNAEPPLPTLTSCESCG